MTDDDHELLLHGLIHMAMKGWLGARHESDALSIVLAQEVPNWQEKVNRVLNDPARRSMTEQGFAVVEKAVDQIVESRLSGEASRLLLQQAVDSLYKKPN